MNNDLISRKALIANIRSRKYINKALCEIFETVIDDAPTAFDKEKVIEELNYRCKNVEEAYNKSDLHLRNELYGKLCAYKNAIDIIEKGGIE